MRTDPNIGLTIFRLFSTTKTMTQTTTSSKSYYLVTYRDQKDGTVISLKVRNIQDSSLGLGFVSLSGFIFEQDSILVQPEEEAKRRKFENVKTLHLSIYSIISIAEMGLEAPKLAFKNDKSNLLMMPSTPATPNE